MGWQIHHQGQQKKRKENYTGKNYQDRRDTSGVREVCQTDQLFRHKPPPLSMKLISWNIRGLNGPRKGRLLKNMIMQEKPSILFLQEMKCSSVTLEKIAAKVCPSGLVATVDAQGASGGLAILWDARATHLNNMQANKSFIQATFHLSGTNTYGLLTNVYFPQETA